MWKETVYLPHTEVINSGGKKVALVGTGSTLQIQVEDEDAGDAYVDLDVKETQVLIAKMQEWIAAKTA